MLCIDIQKSFVKRELKKKSDERCRQKVNTLEPLLLDMFGREKLVNNY